MIGAVYCVYEDSGFLEESIKRVYPCVDMILLLLDTVPWMGTADNAILHDTYAKALALPDPAHKIDIVCKYWFTEADERNFGNKYLRDRNIDWALVIDDDELFNRSEMKNLVSRLNINDYSAYLFKHQLYWKDRNRVIDSTECYLPAVVSTKANRIIFTEARLVTVFEGKGWIGVTPELIVCHHMSYVRTDEKMLRKIRNFSHAKEIIPGWYENVWLAWTEGMKNTHPLGTGDSFRGTMPASEAKYKLEELPNEMSSV